jgi:pimeloyl-ACP methyl ester carboxylesterase
MTEINLHREGSGDPLVLIHGIGSRWQVWLPVIGRLAAQREVIAVDLPGFGFSPRPAPGTPPGASTLARLVGELIEELGLVRPHVAGFSLGGWVSLELAKLGLVRSVTALSPAGFHSQAEGVFQLGALRLARAAARAAAPQAAALLASRWRRKLAFWQMTTHGDRIPPFDAAEHLRALAEAEWFDETLRTITEERFYAAWALDVPVTIAWAEHDRVLRPRQAERAARQLPSARRTVLRGCGHVPTYDDPEQVATVLLEGSARG